MTEQKKMGRLVLVPNTLDLGTGEDTALSAVLPLALIQRAAGLTHKFDTRQHLRG